MTKVIQAPATGGKTVEIIGEEYGPFLVHQSGDLAMVGLLDFPTWRVTHTKSGNRIPFEFLTSEGAVRFAGEAAALHDWDAVETSRGLSEQTKATWVAGKPSKEAILKIKTLAAECGGVRS